MRMSSTVLWAVIVASALTFSAAQSSCKGRCGAEYYRGYMCQCDYNCLSYGECCKDFESQCTTKNSCKGRCGEMFKRGRLCSCDAECVKYNQCCSDFKTHCDAEEPTMNEASEEPSTFSEGNDADDHLIPLTSPTSYSSDDLGDDKNNQIFPSDGVSNNGVEDPEASPIPESTSGYGSTVDLLDQVPVEPTVEFSTETVTLSSQTETTPSNDKPTQADDSHSSLYITSGEGPTTSTDSSDFVISVNPEATAVSHVSIQPSPTSALQTGPTALTSVTEPEGSGQAPEDEIVPDAQKTDLTEAPSDKPEATTTPFNTAYTASNSPELSVSTELTQTHTVLQTTQATTTSTSSTQDLTPNPESATSNPEPDSTDAVTDPNLSTSVAPAVSENLPGLDVLTTPAPLSTAAVQLDSTDDAITTSDPVKVTSPNTPEATSQPEEQPDTHKPSPTKPTLVKPTSKPDSKPLDAVQTLNTGDLRDYQADDSNDTNLCSGRPVSAVTALRNGTIVVFRGHYFWFLDSNRVPGPAQGITQVWGVPSPVDTVFTRCNCQGKTYIFKGAQYWRFENDVLDPGYPKVIETGFDGLRGHITAALSVPHYQSRRESVYFFKRGGFVQKYSYQSGTSPTCGKNVKYALYAVQKRMARQAVSLLEPAINIRRSWRGFPSTITAAVSIPNNRERDGYKYYVFSRSKSYNVRMDSERPVVAASNANRPQSTDVFKCPKKV
ncbi:proteoglycan 4b isoform X2 [Anabas testudineus]|uniref:Proteoglycan 4b n=1 Tax=Anabas testudineus TaxID=64144 RepID=A0A3Q1K507_ANATE|nr:proteoglycan 4b isoform X2 [Anabas testudineus]